MSSVAHRLRAISARLGYRCEFRTGSTRAGDSPVEVHGSKPYEPNEVQPFGRVAGGPTTLLGVGDNHHAALMDAENTLRVRKVPEARAAAKHYSGKHSTPRHPVTMTPEQWTRVQRYCAEHGTTFPEETRRHWDEITGVLDTGGVVVGVNVDCV
jgi:hypothetical protein